MFLGTRGYVFLVSVCRGGSGEGYYKTYVLKQKEVLL